MPGEQNANLVTMKVDRGFDVGLTVAVRHDETYLAEMGVASFGGGYSKEAAAMLTEVVRS